MRKGLIVIMAIGIIMGLTSMVLAVPGPITVTCDFAGGQDCSVGESVFFSPGTYVFQVASGAWGTQNVGWTGLPDPNLSTMGYLWSLYIEVPGNPVPYKLGDDTFNGESDLTDGVFFPGDPGIPDINAAKNAALNNAIINNSSVTVTVGGAGENLRFHMNDPYSRGNEGDVTVAVVPEPVSSSLFLIGGAVLAGRRYLKKRRKN